jgi:type IV secretory pathway VirB10-like protein
MPRGLRSRRACALGVIAVGAGLVSGCAKMQARTVPEGPALQVPSPPAREIVAALDPPPLPVEEPVVPPAPSVAPPVVPPRPAPAPPRAARPAPPAESPAPRIEPRTLRAPGDVAREGAVRERLTGAAGDLGRADYGRLGAAARGQYDQARRFLRQAEQAIKDQNLAFAATLADKAATLAADLAGR